MPWVIYNLMTMEARRKKKRIPQTQTQTIIQTIIQTSNVHLDPTPNIH